MTTLDLPMYLSGDYETSVRWSVDAKDELIASVLTPYMLTGTSAHEDDDREEHRVSDCELEAIHPDFALAVRALITWCKTTYGLQWGTGDEVIATKNYLTTPSYQVRDSFNRLLLLNNIFAITIDERKGGATFMCDSITVEQLHCADREVSVVVESFRGGSFIKKDELDARFPGWLQRYTLGVELGVDYNDVIAYTLNVGTSLSSPMKDIIFDNHAY